MSDPNGQDRAASNSNQGAGAITSVEADRLYTAATSQKLSWPLQLLLAIWTVIGIPGLIVLALAEPFSGLLFGWLQHQGVPWWVVTFLLLPLVMFLRGIVLVEVAGYFYHRFF